MRRILIVFTSLAVFSTASESRLSGQTQSTSLTVNATVTKNCTISTTPVAFGNYDPVVANATAPLDGQGGVTVTCTKGAIASVGLNVGSYPAGGRRMFAGATAFLPYELYKDTTRTQLWGNDSGTDFDIPAAPNRNARTYPVFGRVQAAQDATVGTYADTVVATVNF